VAGQEVLRMVENGNVLLMTKDAVVETNFTNWSSVVNAGVPFILQQPAQDAAPQYRAVLTMLTVEGKPSWRLCLKGDVFEGVADLAGPESGHTAFMVMGKDENGELQVMSLIDDQGNLKMRGYLLVDGIPYSVKQYEETDSYLPSYAG
jgi:hypothetical protein